MSQWYRTKEGKSLGPFSYEELLALVNSAQLSAMDLIFKVGEHEWRPISDWPEFADLEVFSKTKKMWMVYKIRGGKEEKVGPYTSEDIRNRLQKSELKVEDYVWQEGMKDWYQILNIQELRTNSITNFQPTKNNSNLDEEEVSISNEKEIYAQSAADLLKNVKVKDVKQIEELTQTLTTTKSLVKEVTLTKTSFTPGHNNTEGLSLAEKRKELESLMVKIFGEVDLEKDQTKVTQLSQMDDHIQDRVQNLQLTRLLKEQGVTFDSEKKDPQTNTEDGDPHLEKVQRLAGFVDKMEAEDYFGRSQKWGGILSELSALFPQGTWLRLLAIFFTLFTLALILMMSAYRDQSTIKNSVNKNEIEIANQQQLLEKINLKQDQKVPLETVSSVPPTKIVINLNSADKKLLLNFNSNGTEDFPIEVEIYANAKEVIGPGGYYYKQILKNSKPAVLDLNRISVPTGILHIIARSGSVVKSLKLNNFKKKSQFYKDLDANKKQIAIWHQKEKRALFSTVSQLSEYAIQLQSLSSLIDQGGSRWQKAYINLKSRIRQSRSSYMDKVSDTTGSSLVYPIHWLRVVALYRILTELDLQEPKFDYNQFKKEAFLLEEQISDLTLW